MKYTTILLATASPAYAQYGGPKYDVELGLWPVEDVSDSFDETFLSFHQKIILLTLSVI